MHRLAVLCVALVLVLAACGDNDDGASPTASTQATGSPTPTESPSPPPAFVQEVLAPGPKIVFIRGIESDGPLAGRIWPATDDGHLAAPVTPEGAQAVYAGLHRSGGDALLYYATLDDERARTLWEADLITGDSRRVLSFTGYPFDAYASVSPDGRHVAYTDSDSPRLLDLAPGGEDRLLLQGNGAGCEGFAIGGCFVYRTARWSPDGMLLLVQKVYYEGSRPVILDPFFAASTEVPPEGAPTGVNESVGPHAWSPNSDSFCGVNSYDGTGLFVASEPAWQLVDLVPEYELPTGPPGNPERHIRSCDWLNTDAIAFATVVAEYDSPLTRSAPSIFSIEISVHHLTTHETETVATLESDQVLQSPGVFTFSSGAVLVGYFAGPITTSKTTPAQPEIVDLETGGRTAVLSAGAWIVAVVSP